MKKLIQSINRLIAAAAVAGVLFSPVVMGEASAAVSCTCSDGAYTNLCTADGQSCGDGQCSCAPVPTPEMSDYLAMAFILMSGGMIYYFRRWAVVKA